MPRPNSIASTEGPVTRRDLAVIVSALLVMAALGVLMTWP